MTECPMCHGTFESEPPEDNLCPACEEHISEEVMMKPLPQPDKSPAAVYDVIQKALSTTAEEAKWIVKYIRDLESQIACLTAMRRSSHQHMDEQDAKLKEWFECGAKIMAVVDDRKRTDLPLSDGDVIDYIHELQENNRVLKISANLNGAALNTIVDGHPLSENASIITQIRQLEKEMKDQRLVGSRERDDLLKLLGEARNWVQDPVLRASIQKVAPPTPRTKEDG